MATTDTVRETSSVRVTIREDRAVIVLPLPLGYVALPIHERRELVERALADVVEGLIERPHAAYGRDVPVMQAVA